MLGHTMLFSDKKELKFFDEAQAHLIVCEGVCFAAQAEETLFARYQQKEPAYVICCELIDHSGDRLKERVIMLAMERKREGAYLKWLVEENHFASMLLCTDDRAVLESCEGIEALCDWKKQGVTVAENIDAHLNAYLAMHEGAQSILPAAGYLCGFNTVEDCLKDEFARDFLAHAMADEMAPLMPLSREEALRYAADVFIGYEKNCKELLLTDMAENLVGRYAKFVLPLLARHVQEKKAIAPCLCFALSALIMFYAGARPDGKGGYQGVREEEYYPVRDDDEIMHTFSRMSCDMDCDSLAYAVLSDWEMWNNDLRNVPGLMDGVTGQVRDIQLLGSKTALKVAVEQHD